MSGGPNSVVSFYKTHTNVIFARLLDDVLVTGRPHGTQNEQTNIKNEKPFLLLSSPWGILEVEEAICCQFLLELYDTRIRLQD